MMDMMGLGDCGDINAIARTGGDDGWQGTMYDDGK
jgi:hypothetical protein